MANIPEYESTSVPTSNDHPQIVRHPYNTVSDLDLNKVGDEFVETGYAGMKDPCIRLSKNMQLAMRHVGIKENAIPVDEEWKWDPEAGKAVPPTGRDPSASYTKTEAKKFSDYGTMEVKKVVVEAEDPKKPWHKPEECDTIVITKDPVETDNDDPTMVDALPVLAIDNAQAQRIKLEGRRGEVHDDPISEENYLTRPGMEVKTSETYLAQQEAAEEETPAPAPTETPDPDPETTRTAPKVAAVAAPVNLEQTKVAATTTKTTTKTTRTTKTADTETK